MVDELRCGSAFGAQGFSGRMRGIGFEGDEAAVFDHGHGSAARNAERAVAVNSLNRWSVG